MSQRGPCDCMGKKSNSMLPKRKPLATHTQALEWEVLKPEFGESPVVQSPSFPLSVSIRTPNLTHSLTKSLPHSLSHTLPSSLSTSDVVIVVCYCIIGLTWVIQGPVTFRFIEFYINPNSLL